MLHLRARWYSPGTGTFLSVDPVESEPPYQYVRGNPINLTDPSGNAPNCQDECNTPPSMWGNYRDIAQVTCWDIEHSPEKNTESYLKTEATRDPPALLARVAFAENPYDGFANFRDREYVLWIVKLRMEIGFYGGSEGTSSSALIRELFAPNQFSTVTGRYIGGVLDHIGMVHVEKPYEAVRDEAGNCVLPDTLQNIYEALYPCDEGGEADASNSATLRKWIGAYIIARRIYYTPSTEFPNKFPEDLRGYDSFGKGAGYQPFPNIGNKYRDQSDDDETKYNWPDREEK